MRYFWRRIRWCIRSFLKLFNPEWWEWKKWEREFDREHKIWQDKEYKKNCVRVTMKDIIRSGYIGSIRIPMMITEFKPTTYRERIEELKLGIIRMKKGMPPYSC